MRFCLLFAAVLMAAEAGKPAKTPELSPLDQLLADMHSAPDRVTGTSAGSLFTSGSPMLDLAADLRARRLNDLVTVVVFDRASAVAKGATKSSRSSSAQSSITGLGGTPPFADRLANLLKLGSDTSLDGQGETTRETTLNTVLSARVSEVLPNGLLVIEGFKSIRINSETQRVTVRGLVRPVDLTPLNRIASDSIAYLEVTVNGKGVVGDAIRRPNFLYRLLLGLLPF